MRKIKLTLTFFFFIVLAVFAGFYLNEFNSKSDLAKAHDVNKDQTVAKSINRIVAGDNQYTLLELSPELQAKIDQMKLKKPSHDLIESLSESDIDELVRKYNPPVGTYITHHRVPDYSSRFAELLKKDFPAFTAAQGSVDLGSMWGEKPEDRYYNRYWRMLVERYPKLGGKKRDFALSDFISQANRYGTLRITTELIDRSYGSYLQNFFVDKKDKIQITDNRNFFALDSSGEVFEARKTSDAGSEITVMSLEEGNPVFNIDKRGSYIYKDPIESNCGETIISEFAKIKYCKGQKLKFGLTISDSEIYEGGVVKVVNSRGEEKLISLRTKLGLLEKSSVEVIPQKQATAQVEVKTEGAAAESATGGR